MTQTYQVNEIFTSFQGEGFWTGVPATFIRLQGCPVGCPWCDTKYTWHAGGTRMSVDEIVAQIEAPHIVITGGEPTLWALDDLHTGIHDYTHGEQFIQMESSGLKKIDCRGVIDWVTWSPKRNLGFHANVPWEFQILVDEVKFVVDTELEFWDVEELFKKIHPDCTPKCLTFMPEGCPPTKESFEKASAFAKEFAGTCDRVMVSDRLQYRMGVR